MEEDVKDLVTVRAMAKNGLARVAREAANLSLADVGRAVGVAPSTIYRWETARRTPRSSEAALRYGELLRELMER